MGISPTRILQDADSANYMAISDSILPLLTTSATRNDFCRDFTRLTGTFLPFDEEWDSNPRFAKSSLLTLSSSHDSVVFHLLTLPYPLGYLRHIM